MNPPYRSPWADFVNPPACPKCGSRSNMVQHDGEWVCHSTHPVDQHRIVPQSPIELERNAELAKTYKAERDAIVACLDHLRERDWFKDPLEIGSVVCALPADATRKALTNLKP